MSGVARLTRDGEPDVRVPSSGVALTGPVRAIRNTLGYGARMSALDEAAPTAPVQSVDRALTILELLARDGEAGVTEIAQGLGRPQVHGVPAARHPGGAPAGRAGQRPRPLPARRRQPAAGRRHHRPPRPGHRGATGLPPARRGHRGDREHRRPVRDLGAVPRPGRRVLGPPAAQLGGPAHPAARDEQRQGAAQRDDGVRAQGRGPGAAAVHRPRRSRPAPGSGTTWPRSARPGTPSRSTSSRSA